MAVLLRGFYSTRREFRVGKRRNRLHEKVNTHVIHAKQLLVLLTEGVFRFSEDLLTTAGSSKVSSSFGL